jgi:predicted dehydrogenase
LFSLYPELRVIEEKRTLSERSKVRVGIIGPSWWVNFWHLPAVLNHPDAEITGVCGEKPRELSEVQAKYGPNARFYTDMETMLREAPLDGVIVCTPNDVHHRATMAVLNHGLHVTCEKPLALNAAQAQEMAQAAQSRGLIGMTNFPYRDNPCAQTLRRLIAEGYVGVLLHIGGQYHGGFGLTRPPGWRGLRERSGAGILGDLGSHLIDLARFVTGDEFTSVCAHSLTVRRQKSIVNAGSSEVGAFAGVARTEDPVVSPRNDDSCAFLAEMKSGAQGIFHTSWVAYQGAEGQHQELDVYGTGGRLHFVANHTGTFLRGKRLGEARWETIPVADVVSPAEGREEDEDYFRPGRMTSTNTTYRWIEAIRQGKASITPDLTDGWRAQQVIDAVIQASRERRWINIESDIEQATQQNA